MSAGIVNTTAIIFSRKRTQFTTSSVCKCDSFVCWMGCIWWKLIWMSRSHALGHMQKAHCVLFGFIAIWPVSSFANAAPAKWNYCQFWLSVLLLAVDCVHKLNASSTMHIKFDCINFIVHQSAILHCRIPIKLYMAGIDLNNNTTKAQFLHFSRKIGWTVCVTRPGEQLCCAVECLMCPSIDLHVFHTNAT